MAEFSILRMDDRPVVRFAARELKRYLEAATGWRGTVRARKRYRALPHAFWLGSMTALPPEAADRGRARDGGSDTGQGPEHEGIPGEFEEAAGAARLARPGTDRFVVAVTDQGGWICGSNGRSVLLGVYRYLRELGFDWIRPGRQGEVIPRLDSPFREVDLAEGASYDHRGVCIEGAVSWENVRDMVDWLPKLGFNAYFIQFRDGFQFFQRWYEHTGNPLLPRRAFSADRAIALSRRLRAEISKRGLDLHLVGHGWTCEPLGIPGRGWFPHEGPIPEQARRFLAQIDGRRELREGIALNTNLCYGNPEVRRIMVDAIVEYARDNPDVDVLHFWLADGTNNQCECPLCTPHRPADLYVRMLNDLDRALSAEGIGTRIVFLIYVDLLWPPEHERIAHPERFVLMFAPITRSYSSPFAPSHGVPSPGEEDAGLPPYCRNRLEFPRDPERNLAFLRGWQRQFPGDGFDFDYHLMWDHYLDPGQVASARVLHQDIRNLRDIGLNGLMSCQVQRVFFPTALQMVVMGRTLWNRDLDFETVAAEHLEAAFRGHGARVFRFLSRLSQLFDPPLLRGERDEAARDAAVERLAHVAEEVAAMEPLVATGLGDPLPAVRRSWEILGAFLPLATLLAEALRAQYRASAGADVNTVRDEAWAVFHYARLHERELQGVLDVFEFQNTLGPLLGISRQELEKRPEPVRG